MPRTYVALDLETTGLNADRDAIIEVGAVKYRDGAVIDEFTTLINPGRPIPYEITMLTGISDRDVVAAPPFSQIETTLMRFVGSLPVVGHSVGFDLSFTRAQGLFTENRGLDSWELATILLPSLPGYSLGALAARFGLALANAHRALDDARATGQLFNLLCDEAGRLPRAVLMEIVRLAYGSDWPLAEVFAEGLAAAGVGRAPRDALPLDQLAPGSPLFQPWQVAEPLTPREHPEPVDAAELAALLRPDGAFGLAFPGYEYRPPQVDMLEAVAGAFNQGHHLMVEAGTGTGKSLAYLLPAIAFATKNSTRVVVSTNTINLQDQLFKKDLPDLQKVLGMADPKGLPPDPKGLPPDPKGLPPDPKGLPPDPKGLPPDPKGFRKPLGSTSSFRAALLKGRSNYLCPRRFAAFKGRPNLNHDELRGVARILVWLPRTQTGDQGELSLPLPSDRFVWGQVAADNEGCSLDRCQREMGGRCFFYRARKMAEAAHIVVVNHALLMADAATENRVLPEYHHLIIDEVHHLEDAVTDQLSFKADGYTLAQLFNALYPPGGRGSAGVRAQGGKGAGGRGRGTASAAGAGSGRAPGLLSEILTCVRAGTPDAHFAIVRDAIIRLQGDVDAVHTRLEMFWQVLDEAVRDLVPKIDNSEYDLRLRVTAATRSQPVWVDVEVGWDNLGLAWQTLLKHLEAFQAALRDLQAAGVNPKGLENLAESLGSTSLRLMELYVQMETWVMKPDTNSVYWVEVSTPERQGRRITLRAAPVHVGQLVQDHILFKNETVVMTSATLRTAGSFDYVRDRLAAHDADTATVGSPFDYKESTLLYLPNDLPEPNAPGYQTAVEQTLIGLAKALGGRTLALFTSYQQLKRTAQAIAPALTEAGITVLSQGSGSSRHQILETFKAGNKTVLLGTRSFWEGVDVVGSALSALVLVRLPFAVPNDPVVAARSETFDDPFYHYQVPDAILRFRQGFGRLIRSKTDRGVVVVLDKRVTSKSYGRLFLDSLPECTVHKGPLMNLPAAARTWVEG